MATQKSLALADSASMPARVAELEDLLERLLAVQERTVAALDRLAPADTASIAAAAPRLRVLQGGAR